ncbi:DUF2782 domain-containing protein [Marinobacterium rhizophilum]|uniref:DUF2782 domain-containing protein n=1 Tax=Marinobacterium rhizophilum TaxID=420402 RepID=UPI001F0A34FF|nr:DUF2782 domain-containing protein [Marinobacterium rhizophilum]
MMKKLLLLASLLLVPPAQAETLPEFEPDAPQITIRHKDESAFYEYRVNGVLKEVKVVPKIGKPYYLVPVEGSGEFSRFEESSLLIPKWVIFSW